MSTSKGSAAAKAPAKAAAKGTGNKSEINKAAIYKKIEAERKLPMAVKSGKFASAARKRQYVNSKRDKRLAHKSREEKGKKPSFQRMINRRRIQKHVKKEYRVRVNKAKKEGKPAPPPIYVSRIEKRLNKAAEKRKLEVTEKVAKKKARVATAEAVLKSFGPTLYSAERAFKRSGRKINLAALTVKPTGVRPLTAAQQKRIGKPRRNAFPNWERHPEKWSQGAEKSNKKKRALTLAQALEYIKAGRPLPLTQAERRQRAKKRAEAQSAADKKANDTAKVAKKPLTKRGARLEKRAKRWEGKVAAVKAARAKRAEDKKKGVKPTATASKAPAKKPATGEKKKVVRRKSKKIHIVNLDRVKKSYKNKFTRSGKKLRASLVKGTVVIILKGKYAGRRAIFLRQLNTSHDLLVTGPFNVNGVPLYRIPQAFVIATSTRLDIKGLDSRKLTDNLFRAPRIPKKAPKNEEEFFAADKPRTHAHVNLHRSAIQKQTDSFLKPIIAKTPLLKQYLEASFSLSDKDAPHRMKF